MEANTQPTSTTDESPVVEITISDPLPTSVTHTETVSTVADLRAVLRYWKTKFPTTNKYETYVQSGLDFAEGTHVELPKSSIIRMIEAAILNAEDDDFRGRKQFVVITVTATQWKNYDRSSDRTYNEPLNIGIKWSTRGEEESE